MKMFKSMPLKKAKEFYGKIKTECERLRAEHKDTSILKIAMNDIYFFTDELTKDY